MARSPNEVVRGRSDVGFRVYLKDQKTLKSKGPMPLYYECLYGL